MILQVFYFSIGEAARGILPRLVRREAKEAGRVCGIPFPGPFLIGRVVQCATLQTSSLGKLDPCLSVLPACKAKWRRDFGFGLLQGVGNSWPVPVRELLAGRGYGCITIGLWLGARTAHLGSPTPGPEVNKCCWRRKQRAGMEASP